MKKLLLILILTGAWSLSVFGDEEIRDRENKIEKTKATSEEVKKVEEERKDLSDTFIAAFGMDEDSENSLSTGMAGISATSVNHVVTPFTPHMPK
ncbi:hypothetical protein PM10SUCC1_24120 [Propionigenium maris DSM 9537]|uniref:Uncharacterized protein n=1 Tax=Propionigenium maris DSM 9537 TaxID=1123000 RepID=A0A9W6LNR9_9FUSO|nr:hypothetical protein [Propionigenium maris]GLI56898.1 hypothetical protein PM10SUCC1_24120 [Propionigenium maris DSM 9537]